LSGKISDQMADATSSTQNLKRGILRCEENHCILTPEETDCGEIRGQIVELESRVYDHLAHQTGHEEAAGL
jgi:hypothetical protein